MKQRLHMRNDTHMVEFADTLTGFLQIKAFRKSHKEFKGRHIKPVLQAFEDQIECGTIYELTH